MSDADNGTIQLATLRGQPAPAEILADLATYAELSSGVRRHIMEAVTPCLRDPLPTEIEEHLNRFCSTYNAPGGTLARAIKGIRFLVRQASAIDLESEAFADDLAKLGLTELSEVVMPAYDAAKNEIRTEMLRGTLADHGKLVDGIDWRIDTVSASDRGDNFRYAIGVITLRYKEGGRSERVTLQLLPDSLAELRGICDRMLGN